MAQAQTTHATTEAHGGARARSGFPPFETETYGGQLLWLAITFGALYFLLSRLVLPRLTGIIESRREVIARDLDEAAAMKIAGRRGRRALREGARGGQEPRPGSGPGNPREAHRRVRGKAQGARGRSRQAHGRGRGDHHGHEGAGHGQRARHRRRHRSRHRRTPDRQGSGPAGGRSGPRPERLEETSHVTQRRILGRPRLRHLLGHPVLLRRARKRCSARSTAAASALPTNSARPSACVRTPRRF